MGSPGYWLFSSSIFPVSFPVLFFPPASPFPGSLSGVRRLVPSRSRLFPAPGSIPLMLGTVPLGSRVRYCTTSMTCRSNRLSRVWTDCTSFQRLEAPTSTLTRMSRSRKRAASKGIYQTPPSASTRSRRLPYKLTQNSAQIRAMSSQNR